jgi:hypothetical protein
MIKSIRGEVLIIYVTYRHFWVKSDFTFLNNLNTIFFFIISGIVWLKWLLSNISVQFTSFLLNYIVKHSCVTHHNLYKGNDNFMLVLLLALLS